MGDNEASSDVATPHQSRPRKRCRTEHEKRERNLSERKLLMPCNDCKLKCSESYSEHYRGQILSGYWSLNHRERRQWLDGHIRIGEVQRRRLSDQVNIKKERSNTYYLPKENGCSQRVCKTMFMRTLGLTCDSAITVFIKAKVATTSGTIAPMEDGRGKSVPPNKIDRDVIKNHINSYNPVVSHYRREHAPNRRYLDSDLTIAGNMRRIIQHTIKRHFVVV